MGVGRLAGSSRFQEQLGLALGHYEGMSPRQAEAMRRLIDALEENAGPLVRQLVGPVVDIGGSPHQTEVRAIPTVYGLPFEDGEVVHEERGRAFIEEPPEAATELSFGWKNLERGGKLLYEEPEGLKGLNIGAHVRNAMPQVMDRAGMTPGSLVIATPYMETPEDHVRARVYMRYGLGPLDVNKMQMGRVANNGGIVPELLNEPNARFVQNVLRRRRG